jgi:hypothetical protein
MAITIGATVSSTSVANSGVGLTLSHTIDAGINRCLIVASNLYSATAGRNLTGITWDGNAMTKIASVRSADNLYETGLWKYVGPTIKTANIIATPSGINSYFSMVATNFINVDQTTPNLTADSDVGLGANLSTTPTCNNINNMVVCSYQGNLTDTTFVGVTNDAFFTSSGTAIKVAGSHGVGASPTLTITYSGGGSAQRLLVAAALVPKAYVGNVIII